MFGLLAILTSISISNFLMTPLIDFYSIFNLISISSINTDLIIKIVVTFVLLDFANYLIHRFIHFVPFLWRFHRLHHSDRSVDSMTTILHHPLEVFINSIFIIGFYVIFDLPIIFVIFYDILLAIHDAFVHSSIKMPKALESWLGYIFIMPKMHRAHHALDLTHGNSNYGSIFSIWDRLFGTYSVMDANKTKPMIFGIEDTKTPKLFSAKELLINPFI